MDPRSQRSTQGNIDAEAAVAAAARGPSLNRHRYKYNPPAYAPVDPFRPSIAYSLRNLAAGVSEEEDVNVLEDDRPPPPPPPRRATRQQRPPVRAYDYAKAQTQVRKYHDQQHSSSYHLPPPGVPVPATPPIAPVPPTSGYPLHEDYLEEEPSHVIQDAGEFEQRYSREESGQTPVALEHGEVYPVAYTPPSPAIPYGPPQDDRSSLAALETHTRPGTIESHESPQSQSAYVSAEGAASPMGSVQDDVESAPSEVASTSSPVFAYLPPEPQAHRTQSHSTGDLSHDVQHTNGGALQDRLSPLRPHEQQNPSPPQPTLSQLSPSVSPPPIGSQRGSSHSGQANAMHSVPHSINVEDRRPDSYGAHDPTVQPQPAPRVNSVITASGVISEAKIDYLSEKHSVSTPGSSSSSPPRTGFIQRYLPPDSYVVAFVVDTLPRQIYLNLLLRLPYLYFTRVTRIFEEAEMSMPMIRQGILDAARANADAMGMGMGMGMGGQDGYSGRPFLGRGWGVELEPASNNVAYNKLQATWLAFIDALLNEWKTLNIISVLLLSAILTILQIQGVGSDPLTRCFALLSMVCALMSLVYGCIYIIRFATMKKTYKGAAWAQEAQKTKTGIWWNIWVMLAMPATWLAWSVIFYIMTITAFIWRSSPFQSQTLSDIVPLSTSAQILAPRLLITIVLLLGILYFILIASTLRRYGDMMDRAWQKRIWGWMESPDDQENVDVEADREQNRGASWITWRPDKKGYPSLKDEEAAYAASLYLDDAVNQTQNTGQERESWQMYDRAYDQAQAAEAFHNGAGRRNSDHPSNHGQREMEQFEGWRVPRSPRIISRPPITSIILDPVESSSLSPLHDLQNVLRLPAETARSVAQAQTDARLLSHISSDILNRGRNAERRVYRSSIVILPPTAPPVRRSDGSTANFMKLFDLPLPGDFLDVQPSPDDLRKCGLSLNAFNFKHSEGNGWQKFVEHIHSVFDETFQDPPDNRFPETIPFALWFVLELWNAKLQFNGVTGFLASCKPSPDDRTLGVYYFHECYPDGDSPSESIQDDDSDSQT